MVESKFEVVIRRDGQPAHQMGEMTATVSGPILLGIIRTMIETQSGDGINEWFSPSGFGTLKSLTITRVEDGD